MNSRGTFTVSGFESDPRKVVQVHSSLRTSANASVNVGRDLSYQAARRMVGEPSWAICRWAQSVTREKRPNSAGVPSQTIASLSLEPQALAHLLEGCLHLPAPYKPRDDPLGLRAEIGAKERLSPKLFTRITDQEPTQGHGGQARGVPEGGVRDHLDTTPFSTIPLGNYHGPPLRTRIFGHYGKVWQTLALEPRPSHLMGASWRGRLVESRIQPQATDEGDRVGEASAALEQFERCVSAIGDGHDLPLWVPAPH